MRLRSSKFVVLLLLACCVQLADDVALRLLAAPMLRSARDGEAAAAAQVVVSALRHGPQVRPVEMRLPAAAQACAGVAWTMRQPAAATSALTQYTGFLRG